MVWAILLSTHKPVCCNNASSLIEELDGLVAPRGMEVVVGAKFPVVNPYGSYGSPYVLDFLFPSENGTCPKSVLILCRKKHESHDNQQQETPLELVHGYSYFLVFATKAKHDDAYAIQSVIPNASLMGMSLYYGNLDINLSQFHYVDDSKRLGPQEIYANFTNGCIPIVISSESSTQILYYYKGRWLTYIEIDK